MNIREIFDRPIERQIEEVIKVDQVNQDVVYRELDEYIPTPVLQQHLEAILNTILDARLDPTEGIGAWISGFFGSGKSSFAKILGYLLGNPTVKDQSAATIINRRFTRDNLKKIVDQINREMSFTVVMFSVASELTVRTGRENVSALMYRALLRELGYAEDFDLAELEITLEREGRFEAFTAQFRTLHNREWDDRKDLIAFALNEASAVMHDLDPQTYPQADTWARTRRDIHIDTGLIAERSFELMRRRRLGQSLVYVVDEVGQYVGRSVDRMLDMQGMVETLGRVGKNWVQQGRGKNQTWLIVTSQEKLSEVVEALGDKRIELARLQDRFPDRLRVDLGPTDIAEVTSQRVLLKKPDAEKQLRELFRIHRSRLATHLQLHRTSRRSDVDEKGFADLYPFLPYQVDLIINIVSGLRAQPGASQHTGGSNRTIIKHAQQMIINPKTALGSQPVGRLVTLDLVYDLLEGSFPSERRKDIEDVKIQLSDEPMAARVVKVIALLEFVRGVPRTTENIAAMLYEQVDGTSAMKAVESSIKKLEQAQFIRDTPEDGWKLQSVLEKSWVTERGEITPLLTHKKELRRNTLRSIFEESRLRTYRYRDIRTFRVAISADGVTLHEGDISLILMAADDESDFERLVDEARESSRPRASGESTLYWIAPMTSEVNTDLVEIYRSREMTNRHERDARTAEEYELVRTERERVLPGFVRKLEIDLRSSFAGGVTFFRGVERPARELGSAVQEVLKALLDLTVPNLYTKFDVGAYQADERDAEKFLTATNLSGLPTVYHEGKDNMRLIRQEKGRYLVDKDIPTTVEVMTYIRRMHSYGEKVTGRALEETFQKPPFGWDSAIVKVVLAALMRAGVLEITFQGRRYTDYQQPAIREVFAKIPAFRSAAFAPRAALGFAILSSAVRYYEEIYGRELDLEEGVISHAVSDKAREEREVLLPLEARIRALGLPGVDFLTEFRATLEGLAEGDSDEVVKTFASEGPSFHESLRRMRQMATATSGGNLETLQRARIAVSRQLPPLEERLQPDAVGLGAGARLREVLLAESVYDRLSDIGRDLAEVNRTYETLFTEQMTALQAAYDDAIAQIRSNLEWPNLPREAQEQVLALLRPPTRTVDSATLEQIELDLARISSLQSQALQRIIELTTSTLNTPLSRVRASALLSGVIADADDLERRIEALREHLLKLLAGGSRVIIE